MTRFVAISIATLFFSLNLAAKTSLGLHAGTMQIGGFIQMPISIPKDGPTSVGLNLSPSWDYFLSRSFSLGFSPSIMRNAITNDREPWNFSIVGRGFYYFDLGGALYPYLGAGAGVGWKTRVKGLDFILTTPIGMLVAINNRIAIDLGVPVTFVFNGDGYRGALLPVGYLGVRAFF